MPAPTKKDPNAYECWPVKKPVMYTVRRSTLSKHAAVSDSDGGGRDKIMHLAHTKHTPHTQTTHTTHTHTLQLSAYGKVENADEAGMMSEIMQRGPITCGISGE